MTLVLVVDDDPAIRRTLWVNLRARGYEVETAGDGRSALRIVDERMPGAILLDLGLPDLDGISVFTRLRTFAAVPLIVVSGRTDSDDRIEALDLGADDCRAGLVVGHRHRTWQALSQYRMYSCDGVRSITQSSSVTTSIAAAATDWACTSSPTLVCLVNTRASHKYRIAE